MPHTSQGSCPQVTCSATGPLTRALCTAADSHLPVPGPSLQVVPGSPSQLPRYTLAPTRCLDASAPGPSARAPRKAILTEGFMRSDQRNSEELRRSLRASCFSASGPLPAWLASGGGGRGQGLTISCARSPVRSPARCLWEHPGLRVNTLRARFTPRLCSSQKPWNFRPHPASS